MTVLQLAPVLSAKVAVTPVESRLTASPPNTPVWLLKLLTVAAVVSLYVFSFVCSPVLDRLAAVMLANAVVDAGINV